jgi:hypothetical protein
MKQLEILQPSLRDGAGRQKKKALNNPVILRAKHAGSFQL